MCAGKVFSRYSTSSTRRVTTVQIRLYIMNGEKEQDCVLTNATYPLSYVMGNQVMVVTVKQYQRDICR